MLFVSCPAFVHWLAKPAAAGGGGCSSWSSITLLDFVTVTPYLLNSSRSMPYSVSVETSGRRFRLPSWFGLSAPPAPMVNVSYCAEKFGRLPACPTE